MTNDKEKHTREIDKQPFLQIRNLHKTYFGAQPLHVLKGVNLTIEEGEMVAIMGASGSGKSTLLNILGLLDRLDEGEYFLQGRSMKGIDGDAAAKLRNKFLGFVFQSFNLIPYKDAIENISLPLYYAGVPRKQRTAKAKEMLERVGLLEWSHHLPSELSGGQKQRIAIARALINEPLLILADEPTGALDSKTTMEVMELLQEVNATGKTIIVITHEPEVAKLCHRTIYIKDGLIVDKL